MICEEHLRKKLIYFLPYLLIFFSEYTLSHREERLFFPIIPFYRVQTISPTPCEGIEPDRLQGTCTTLARCRNAGLISAAPCQGNQGFCCVDIKYCGGSSSSPVFYFRSSATFSSPCSLTVTKTNSSICQLRLDFIEFSLPQPSRGICQAFLQLSIADNSLPKICGDNAGQHVYVDFLPNCDDQTLSFKSLSTTGGNWNIKITQIPCNSPLAAPRGCLQYYSTVAGTVKSFNFGISTMQVLRQLSPLQYNVCILPQFGYCSVSWRTTTNSSFILQNRTITEPRTCESNYVALLNPECNAGPCPPRNRFCETNFTGVVTSSARIFELQVVNNYQDSQTDGDSGFSLDYQQNNCN